MTKRYQVDLADIFDRYESEILRDWLQEQLNSNIFRTDIMSENVLKEQSHELLILFKEAFNEDNDINSPAWTRVKDYLGGISRSRALQGYSPTETATLIFSLKQPMFNLLQKQLGDNATMLKDGLWAISILLDSLGLYTTEVYQRSKEEIIIRQQREMVELSTPVVQLWTGILALPLIGTLDSARTQVVMESLLTKIVETGSSIAIIDITGVPMVDTLVAQHLLKTIAAARLMGADCIISGIRPQIAQTIVHLGVNLSEVSTKATMADAFKEALKKNGLVVATKNHN